MVDMSTCFTNYVLSIIHTEHIPFYRIRDLVNQSSANSQLPAVGMYITCTLTVLFMDTLSDKKTVDIAVQTT